MKIGILTFLNTEIHIKTNKNFTNVTIISPFMSMEDTQRFQKMCKTAVSSLRMRTCFRPKFQSEVIYNFITRRHWFGQTVLLSLRLLEAYAYCKLTKYNFRFSKILIFRLNIQCWMFNRNISILLDLKLYLVTLQYA